MLETDWSQRVELENWIYLICQLIIQISFVIQLKGLTQIMICSRFWLKKNVFHEPKNHSKSFKSDKLLRLPLYYNEKICLKIMIGGMIGRMIVHTSDIISDRFCDSMKRLDTEEDLHWIKLATFMVIFWEPETYTLHLLYNLWKRATTTFYKMSFVFHKRTKVIGIRNDVRIKHFGWTILLSCRYTDL